jgi:release factor glutamine methyltransferase
MEHLSNSKELFRTLVSHVKLSESKDEIESIVLLLLEKRCGLTRAEIMAGKDTVMSIDDLLKDMMRINAQEPIQYVLGVADFFGREFTVDQSVLIPRPETELLVYETLRFMRSNKTGGTALDIGTGSGCIAITLALESPFEISAIDVSADALWTARENAARLKAPVTFMLHDFLIEKKVQGTWDVIVSNPPYVRHSEASDMKANVIDHEPHLALFVPNEDALIFYRAIAVYGLDALRHNGVILVEVNEFLAKETKELFTGHGYECTLFKDISNKDRVLMARRCD